MVFGDSFPFCVISGSRESSEIGMSVLRSGGNAIDAAIAVSMALGVAEPYGSGLGGKLILLYFDKEKGTVTSYEGIEAAPETFDRFAFRKLPYEKRQRGAAAVAVPGALAVLDTVHKELGVKAWADLILPSAKLARQGFVMTEHDVNIFSIAQRSLRSGMGTAELYTLEGAVPEKGIKLPNLPLASTLERIARNGSREVYHRDGITAQLLVNFSEKSGGAISFSDLEAYRVRKRAPLSLDWGPYQLLTAPSPSSGGAVVLFSLLGLEALEADRFGTTRFYHQFAVALQEAYALLNHGFGDRLAPEQDQERFFSESALTTFKQRVRNASKKERAKGEFDASVMNEDLNTDSTTHFIIMDSKGNVVSATQSLGSRFGSAAIAEGTGFLLNNSLKNFAYYTESSPNLAGPFLRPRTTVSPMIILQNGKCVLAIGAPAGQRIPTGVAQVVWATLKDGVPLKEAISHPRFHLPRALTRRENPNQMEFEEGVDLGMLTPLPELGWDVRMVSASKYYFGGVNALKIESASGEVSAVGDERRSNISLQEVSSERAERALR